MPKTSRWNSSDRVERLPANWASQVRPVILSRDKHRCQWPVGRSICGRYANQVDHITPGDNHSPDNLQALCTRHHAEKSSREGVDAARALRARLKAPQDTHPGLLP